MKKERKVFTVNNMVKMSILAAISAVLMMFDFPIPIAPPFMKVDFADVATLMSGFILGPIAGAITVVLKNLINLLLDGTTTAYVGELSNVIVGATYVMVSSFVYHRNKDKKHALLGLVAGVVAMTLVATLSNYFVIFPMYGKMFGIPLDAFAQQVPGNYASTFKDVILLAVIPFNLIKGSLNAIATFLLYKRVSKLMRTF